MIQNIIVAVIGIIVFVLIAIRLFSKKKNSCSSCSLDSSSCSGCKKKNIGKK